MKWAVRTNAFAPSDSDNTTRSAFCRLSVSSSHPPHFTPSSRHWMDGMVVGWNTHRTASFQHLVQPKRRGIRKRSERERLNRQSESEWCVKHRKDEQGAVCTKCKPKEPELFMDAQCSASRAEEHRDCPLFYFRTEAKKDLVVCDELLKRFGPPRAQSYPMPPSISRFSRHAPSSLSSVCFSIGTRVEQRAAASCRRKVRGWCSARSTFYCSVH
ncbi:hypothetical protein BLNAU_20469 [Blattamonas nauphoetae]|uniref:Uncharacterized protein n=1 Tax=Blattamonas nauphoetae TaxID=2049346 RepID=A0ABQ9WYL3_9EUKA|nr:hypothetical protein BLNAU_20469 [Blattamonas nauphoetae]